MLVNSDSNLDHNDDVSVCSDDNSNIDSNSDINDDVDAGLNNTESLL